MKIQKIKTNKFTWVDIEKPSRDELEKIKKSYKIHSLDIEDVLTYTQRPKVEKYKDYIFLITRFPVYKKNERKFYASEVDIFVGKNFFITIHRGDITPLQKLFKDCKNRKKDYSDYLINTPRLLHGTLRSLFLDYFPMIDHINDDIDGIEENIFMDKEKEMVEEIMYTKRNIITLRRIIRPHRKVMKDLEELDNYSWFKKMGIYFSDVTDFVERIWEISSSQRESIVSLENTNEAIITHKQSEIIKTLTIFSAVLLPLTLIASVYGMNITTMPFIDHPLAFYLLLIIMLFAGICFAIYFRIKKWF